MKNFDIITLFPETITTYAETSILGKAQKNKHISINPINLRNFGLGKYKQVDDTPYGGGAGMILKVEPIFDAVQKTKKKKLKPCIITTAANGKLFTQQEAQRLIKQHDQFIFICGRYEGIDERVITNITDEVYSIGPYVLTGGELPALTMTDCLARLIPGVLGNEDTLNEESHTEPGKSEYPQYTKPEHFEVKKGLFKKETWSVPPVLLSGDHAKIKNWRQDQSNKLEK